VYHLIEFLQKINWLDGVAGAIIGILLPFALSFAYNFLRRNRRVDISGTWYSFNITDKDGQTQIASYEWAFKRSLIKGNLVARGTSMIDPTVFYMATFCFNKEYLHLHGKGVEHDEYVTMIFRRKYPYKEKKMIGVFLGFDYSKSPVSGITVLSREASLSPDILQTLHNSKIRFHLNSPISIEVIPYEPITSDQENKDAEQVASRKESSPVP
jgi:hypothetical protein